MMKVFAAPFYVFQNSERPTARKSALPKQGEEIGKQRRESKETGREKGKMNISSVGIVIYGASASP